MCGIAGVYLKDPNNKFIADDEMEKLVDCLLVGIEPRGDHASGIAAMDRHGIVRGMGVIGISKRKNIPLTIIPMTTSSGF